MRDFELPPREETDSYGRDRGQVSRADQMLDHEEIWCDLGEDDAAEWELGQMNWLEDLA